MYFPIERRDEILKALQSCPLDAFEDMLERFIDHVELVSIPRGRGYLHCPAFFGSEQKGKIQVSRFDSTEDQEFTFVHEVFHLFLLEPGHRIRGTIEYWVVERAIDIAAGLFLEYYR